MPERPTVICVTPVRNEARFLPNFLATTETWADAIVIVDQRSTDGSREIALRHPKVVFVDNPTTHYDEGQRRRLMWEKARHEFPGPRIVLCLDVDEALTPGAPSTRSWQAMLHAAGDVTSDGVDQPPARRHRVVATRAEALRARRRREWSRHEPSPAREGARRFGGATRP
jgi:glycosyltransferase involved in cell wall biosynthesis